MTVVWVAFTPRTGSSMLMHMLHQGGLSVLRDEHHESMFPVEANIHGYYESLAVKHNAVEALGRHETAEPYAVKVPVRWVPSLLEAGIKPDRVLVPTRDRVESMASWQRFFGSIPMDWQTIFETRGAASEALERAGIPTLEVPYDVLLDDPLATTRGIVNFLGLPLDVEIMAAIPDEQHRHFRRGELGDVEFGSLSYR